METAPIPFAGGDLLYRWDLVSKTAFQSGLLVQTTGKTAKIVLFDPICTRNPVPSAGFLLKPCLVPPGGSAKGPSSRRPLPAWRQKPSGDLPSVRLQTHVYQCLINCIMEGGTPNEATFHHVKYNVLTIIVLRIEAWKVPASSGSGGEIPSLRSE